MSIKFKTTQKAIKSNYTYIICVGYCQLQNLLNGLNPIAYTVRREGWGCDVYELAPDIALTTGYAPFGNVRLTYDICRRYEREATTLMYKTDGSYDFSYPQLLEALRHQFVQEVLQR